MALAEVIFRGATKRGSIGRSDFGVITFDAIIEEVHRKTLNIVEHPVGVGTNIVDHIRPNMEELELRGVVTDQPVQYLSSILDAGRIASLDAYDLLTAIMNEQLTVDVVTSLREYTNMAIASLTVPRTANSKHMLMCEISLREVRYVESETVLEDPALEPIPARRSPRNGSRAKPANNGAQTTKPASAKQTSSLFSIGQGLFGGQ